MVEPESPLCWETLVHSDVPVVGFVVARCDRYSLAVHASK